MSRNYTPPDGFGVSWGGRGFRIGRSQYGTWWVSVGLPFGFRVTKRLGKLRDSNLPDDSAPQQPSDSLPPSSVGADTLTSAPARNLTANEKILERIRSR